MKAILTATVLLALMSGSTANAAKDRTQYDCRVVVGYRTEYAGRGNIPVRRPILACPHKEQMAAGKCETHWFRGMRCKE